METPEMQLPGTQVQAIGAREKKHRDSEISDECARDAETHDCAAQEPEACAGAASASEPQVNANTLEEDETQLAAIREFMTRASSRGIWLTLTEIAEATEFAEASISAQLRHLRKPHHGAHRVEKRRRGRARAAGVLRKSRHARRGPVIWEYRVSAGRTGRLPHGH
jgi:hypothetical protein